MKFAEFYNILMSCLMTFLLGLSITDAVKHYIDDLYLYLTKDVILIFVWGILLYFGMIKNYI